VAGLKGPRYRSRHSACSATLGSMRAARRAGPSAARILSTGATCTRLCVGGSRMRISRGPLRLLALLVCCAGIACAKAGDSTAPSHASHVVLVTLDGARWQEVFGGMDESLLRSTMGNDADVTASPSYKQFAGASAGERRERLMPFLWRTFLVDHGF